MLSRLLSRILGRGDWLDAWRSAVGANVALLELQELAAAHESDEAAGFALAELVEAAGRFEHRGNAHRVTSLRGVRQRGYGSCADASAAVAAVGLLRGIDSLTLCMEEMPGDIAYLHARVAWGSMYVEPWSSFAFEVQACAAVAEVRSVLLEGRRAFRWASALDGAPLSRG